MISYAPHFRLIRPMLRVEVFGGLAVVAESGDSITLQRRRLALLATLAAASARGATRDQLVGYFWPEAPSDVARHSLEQLIYVIRRQFGEGVLRGGDPLSLNPEFVTSDVAEFRAAIQRGDDEEAVRLHRGPFLDGVYLSDAPEFERWTTRERSRAITEVGGCFERLAVAATARGELRASVEWRLRRAAAEPLSAAHALHLMRALAAVGDRTAALQHARTYQSLVQLELGGTPDPAVAALADELRTSVITPARPVVATEAADLSVITNATPADGASKPGRADSDAARELPDAHDVPPPRYKSRTRRGLWLSAVAICVTALVTAIAVSRSHALQRAKEVAVPSEVAIAVLPLESLSRDSTTTAVADVLTAALIETLTQSGAFRVIQGPSTLFFQGHERTHPSAIADSLGATILMSGAVERDGQNLRIALRLISPRDATVQWARVY
ncbi:MAG: BTAD domain-containing putative transcriptional regulator, partial [Gemmatimonadaceae bacterium]